MERTSSEHGVDLESWEYGLRQAVLCAGARLLERLVDGVLADGARYNWEIAALHFYGCTEIVDLYHAREHLHDLCALLKPKCTKEFTKLEMQMLTWLDEGKVKKIIAKAEDKKDAAQKQIGYFRKDGKKPYGDTDPGARAKSDAYTLETGGVGPATVTKLVHQGWLGMMYQNVDKVRKALEDNQDVVKKSFTKLLASYAGAAESEAENNADSLFKRAIDKNTHPVHAVDALELVLPELMR